MTRDGTKQLDTKLQLSKVLDAQNVAEFLSEEDLIRIGDLAVSGYDNDLSTRSDWEKDLSAWTELALQVSKQKTFPWPNAANIKYPLLATAAMQFAARAYPTLVPSNGEVVKCKVVGSDHTGEKAQRAKRISTHMSYQVMYEMEEWEEDMDKLLLSLPIAGTCFKKTYWDSAKQRNCSKLVLPKFLVVNNFAKNLEEAERVTEVVYLTERQIIERQNRKVFLDVKLQGPGQVEEFQKEQQAFTSDSEDDTTTPYTLLEQHTYLDLDGDGYSEPYVLTVDYNSKQVLRIVPRFDSEGIELAKKGDVLAIKAIQYYTKYSFIPNPDGGFYDIGFGRLLGPLNESANTIINQLVDAGSLSNLQAGFIGKGLRIKMGETRFQPGEWKAVNAIGDDLKKQIFPLPVREPSQVLFNLLDLLLKSGKELASVAEIFVGKMPGQNTPATTTMATIEQGMKVFTAVYKRVYRSLAKEFRKIYILNRTYMNPEEYISVLDEPVPREDYKGPEDDIVPGADPTAVSSQEKQAKVQALMQLLQLGTIDPMAVTKLYLEAHEIPNPEQYMKQPQPQPDPKVEALKVKAQLDQQKAQSDMQMNAAKMQMEGASKEQEMQMKARMAQMELQMKQLELILKAKSAQADLAAKQADHQMSMQQQHQQNQLSMAQSAATHAQSMQQQKEVAKQQPKEGKPKK